MTFRYWVVRYVPDPVREEFVNVGVIAGDGADWDFRRVANLQRASRIGGSATETRGFMQRIETAVEAQLDSVAALLNDPRERMSDGLLTDLQSRLNGIVQLSAPRTIRAHSAKEATDFAYGLMVVDPDSKTKTRSRTALARRTRRAFEASPGLAPYIVRNRRALVERQSLAHDVALRDEQALQLTRAWAFDVPDFGRLETSIQAWNYLAGRVQNSGGKLVPQSAKDSPGILIPRDVALNVVYGTPTTAEGEDHLGIALQGWEALGIHAVSDEHVQTLVDEARAQLVTT